MKYFLLLATTTTEGEVAGQFNILQFIIVFGTLLGLVTFFAMKSASKTKESKNTVNSYEPPLPSYTNYKPNPNVYAIQTTQPYVGGRSGWYPDAEGTKEFYMEDGVTTQLERPFGYGQVTDSKEQRPGGEEPEDESENFDVLEEVLIEEQAKLEEESLLQEQAALEKENVLEEQVVETVDTEVYSHEPVDFPAGHDFDNK